MGGGNSRDQKKESDKNTINAANQNEGSAKSINPNISTNQMKKHKGESRIAASGETIETELFSTEEYQKNRAGAGLFGGSGDKSKNEEITKSNIIFAYGFSSQFKLMEEIDEGKF